MLEATSLRKIFGEIITLLTRQHKFIFKGGFLLSYMMKIGRETVDLDFLLTRLDVEVKGLQEVFEEIVSICAIEKPSSEFI